MHVLFQSATCAVGGTGTISRDGRGLTEASALYQSGSERLKSSPQHGVGRRYCLTAQWMDNGAGADDQVTHVKAMTPNASLIRTRNNMVLLVVFAFRLVVVNDFRKHLPSHVAIASFRIE